MSSTPRDDRGLEGARLLMFRYPACSSVGPEAEVTTGRFSCRIVALRSGEKAEWEEDRRLAVEGKL